MQLKDNGLFKQACLIDGLWCGSSDSTTLTVTNPATGQVLGVVPSVTAGDVGAALDAAQNAFSPWQSWEAGRRQEVLYYWCELLLQHEEDLATLITSEQGKPFIEARGEVRYAASYLKWFAEECPRNAGEILPGSRPGQKIMVHKQAVGVCAVITPWNFPIAMLARKVAAALAAGCTVVAKPSELTPFSAMAFAQLGLRAGVPAGVLNIVTGDAETIGEAMCHSSVVKKISFTGSTRVGQLLMAKAAHNIQRLSLELGGNAPAIIFADADLDAAVKGVVEAKFRNSGQTCISINRLYVEQKIYNKFVAKLQQAITALVVGNGFDADSQLGPLINQAAVDKFHRHIDDALKHGAQRVLPTATLEGLYVAPVLLTHATQDMLFCREETFGPLLAAIPFEREEDAIAMANDSPVGLAGYFYTRDLARAMRIADALAVGMVGVNDTAISRASAPFGGVKHSGFGREGSSYGIAEYQQVKYVLLAS